MKKRIGIQGVALMLCAMFLMNGCGFFAGEDDIAAPEQYENFTGRVSYLGPEGTYTEEATQLFFGPDGTYLPQKTVEEAVDKLLEGQSEYAVIPQENTIGGPVYNYVDELLSQESISVVGEVELTIRQALLVAEGTSLADVKVVYSHQQGIVQGKEWLETHLPEAEVVEVSSTAEGAKMVSEQGDGSCAAIASTGAAKVYGLQVAAENIQQNDNNRTRFYVLSSQKAYKGESDRMLFSAMGDAGDLPTLLKELMKYDLTLVSIHDRPEKTVLGNYIYLIEVENGSYSEYEKISKLPAFEFQYYGAFPVK